MKLLYCWELGDDLGHISSFVPLATELRRRGHDIYVALRDVQHAQRLLANVEGVTILQAPVRHSVPEGLAKVGISYADILFSIGFADPSRLTGMVRAWQDLFRLVRPDLLLVDHGPTALLAGRVSGLPRLTYGAGFGAPVSVDPFPSTRKEWDVPLESLVKAESALLGSMNRMLAGMGQPPLSSLSELFPEAKNILLTYPELDHYANRQHGHYFGAVINSTWKARATWPDGHGKKVFAYLKARYRRFESVLTALTALDCRSVVYAGGASARERAKHCNSRLEIIAEPVDIFDVIAQCDLVVCHGGIGTIAASLLGGKPLLLLPMHQEQGMQTERIVELGAGLTVELMGDQTNFVAPLGRLLSEPAFTDMARKFQVAHRSPSQREIVASIADRCEREAAVGESARVAMSIQAH